MRNIAKKETHQVISGLHMVELEEGAVSAYEQTAPFNKVTKNAILIYN